MKNIKINKFKIILFFLLSFLFPTVVNAATASTGFSGSDSVYVGNNIDITLYVNESGSNGGLAGFGGMINYDQSKLELVGTTSLAPFQIDINGNKIAGFGQNTIKGFSNVIKFTFKSKAIGSTNISFTGGSQPDSTASPVQIIGSSKTINIVNPPSSNANLASLSVSNGSISFDKNKTNYNMSVDSNVSSVNINASAEDGGSSVSGLGQIGLNYGENIAYIKVTAPSGATKLYTVNINRKDNRSGNNNLSSLVVNDGTLEPNFSPNVDSYNLSVPYSVTNLNINASAADGNSKISISGNDNLISEETVDVKIYVTAENGAVKTYTIHTKRGKDPDKVLSTNNYLSHLDISVGILSPAFNKEREIYIVYLPYEVDSINIDATPEDTKYGILNKTGPEKLSVGNNEYELKVTAENEQTKTYKLIVVRGASLEVTTETSKAYLKELKIENGKLIEKFTKEKTTYSYNKGSKDLKITAIAENDDDSVTVLKSDDIYAIVVESASANGETIVYILRPKTNSIVTIILSIALVTTTSAGICIFIKFKPKNIENKK